MKNNQQPHQIPAIKNEPILIVDEDNLMLNSLKMLLEKDGFGNIHLIDDGNDVMDFIYNNPVSVVVLNPELKSVQGFTLLNQIKSHLPTVPVIMLTSHAVTELIVESMRNGAFDIIVKPVDFNRFSNAMMRAAERKMLLDELKAVKSGVVSIKPTHEAFAHIITKNKQMFEIFDYLESIADSSHPILITGETGSGKELVARAVHQLSCKNENFVPVNIAGLDDAVFSDTLFGHKKGAFTGADATREGLIARAEGGTLFLDEIGDLMDVSQVKLLRLLQENTYYPLGSDVTKTFKARVVLATNRNLLQMVNEGTFRKDLFYRISTHHVHIPPLRERPEDIPALIRYFISRASVSLDRPMPAIPAELVTLLSCYDFPGNIRELESMINDSVARHQRGVLSLESFRQKISDSRAKRGSGFKKITNAELILEAFFGHFPTLSEMDDYLVEMAIKKANGNQGIAAGLLGISRQAMNKRLKNTK